MTLPTDANISTLTQTGLTVESKANLIAFLEAAYQSIYGADINVDSNSPDGQLVNIQAQAMSDFLELLSDVYNSFAVDTAYGTRLDQLVALNGIQRIQGTYTQAYVLVTVSRAVTLPGQDQTALTPFTVEDSAGNQFELVTSYVFSGSGSATLVFKAVDIGQVQTTANTITNIVTSTLGVTSVNNPSVSTDSIGVAEETDAQLRVRHAQSFCLAATGPSDSLESVLKNMADIVDAYVVENNTGSPVGSLPAHSIWVVVRGGTDTEIAAAIYAKKAPGCAMVGSSSAIVTRPNGDTFTAKWDAAVAQPLYVKFSITWKGAATMSNADIETALAAALTYNLGENPNIGDILIAMNTIAPTAIVSINSASQGVSDDGGTWASAVQPTTAQNYYTLDAGDITIS